MKKTGLLLLAVVMVAGFAGCGGGDDDSGGMFNFNGRWAYQGIVVKSNVPALPVGKLIKDVATITASGNDISVDFPGDTPPATGTCDPVSGTFQVKVVHNGLLSVTAGHSTDSDAMAGNEVWTQGTTRVEIDWTMTLDSRMVGTPEGVSWDTAAGAFVNAANAGR